MNKLHQAIALTVLGTLIITTTGCAVLRDQESVGAYVDDSAITARVKARFVEDATVDAASISVETLKGTVQLSGFAKSSDERNRAEAIARGVSGVIAVQNRISVRP